MHSHSPSPSPRPSRSLGWLQTCGCLVLLVSGAQSALATCMTNCQGELVGEGCETIDPTSWPPSLVLQATEGLGSPWRELVREGAKEEASHWKTGELPPSPGPETQDWRRKLILPSTPRPKPAPR